MLENGKISNIQVSVLIFNFTIGVSFLTVPSQVAKVSKQDGWITAIFSLGCGLILVWLYGILARRYPNLTVAQYSEIILGRWTGKTVSFLFSLFFLLLTTLFLRVTGDFLITHVLTETPIQAIEILFLLIIIMGVRLGLETFSRTSEMLFPYVLLFLLLLIGFLLPQVELKNITPIFEHGLNPIIRGTYHILGMPYLSLVIFLMIAPYVDVPEKVGKSLLISSLFGGILLILTTSLSLLVLGPEVTARLNFPPYVLAQRIDIGNFIQRIEIISGAFIFITLFLKTTITFYAMVLSLAQTLELKNYNLLTLPLGIIVLVISISFFPNIIYYHAFISEAWTPIALIFGLIFPLLLLGVDMIKSKLTKRTDKKVDRQA